MKRCTTSLGQRTLSFESFFILLLAAHSSGFHKSTGVLRTAFSGAVGGLAQHNQRRIPEWPGEAEGGEAVMEGAATEGRILGGDCETGEDVKETMTAEGSVCGAPWRAEGLFFPPTAPSSFFHSGRRALSPV